MLNYLERFQHFAREFCIVAPLNIAVKMLDQQAASITPQLSGYYFSGELKFSAVYAVVEYRDFSVDLERAFFMDGVLVRRGISVAMALTVALISRELPSHVLFFNPGASAGVVYIIPNSKITILRIVLSSFFSETARKTSTKVAACFTAAIIILEMVFLKLAR